MKALVLLHRWLGIAFCLLFAMWFSSGIVMHFVPFPSLDEATRFAGLVPIDLSQVRRGPDKAVAASHEGPVSRLRLLQRPDGPVYVMSTASALTAVHAGDLSDAAVKSEPQALDIARAFAERGGIDAAHLTPSGLADYDQWTVPAEFDFHRPLYRVAINDVAGTEMYVSSTSGEVVLATTRHQRMWNYVGSVVHWIYPTVLRIHATVWAEIVWTVSLLALVAAMAGTVLGLTRLQVSRWRLGSPFQGWHAWHHVLGLCTATFVLTWIFSGWLSMDNGLLFSRGRLSPEEAARLAPKLDWRIVARDNAPIAGGAREVEWFALGEHLYRRERTGVTSQSIHAIGAPEQPQASQAFLTGSEVAEAIRPMAPDCAAPVVVAPNDDYPVGSSVPGAPVYRSICGDIWLQVDGADGAMLERLDASRRRYRWLYGGLHTLDFPVLLERPALRNILIVGLCALGFVFSVTGVVIGWRRLRSQFV